MNYFHKTYQWRFINVYNEKTFIVKNDLKFA